MTPSPGRRHLHLNVNIFQSGIFAGAWRAPDGDPRAAFSLDHYLTTARIAEAAKLDAVFLADTPVLTPDVAHRPEYALEPTVILAGIAAHTRRIGLIATASTSYNEPYNIARRFAALDHLSRGRAGFNAVTTAGPAAARNFGLDQAPAHRDRYRRAAEFVETVGELWDSWDDDALIGDAARGVFADPARIHTIDHRGEFFRVRGPLNTPRSPQGRPVLVQAGGSPDGIELAAAHAEAVFSAAQTLDEGTAYYRAVKSRAAALGRDPEGIVVLPGLSTVVAATRDEALERLNSLQDLIPLRYGLDRLAALLGIDADALDPDAELPWDLIGPAEDVQGLQTFFTVTTDLARRERLTARQLIRRLGGGLGHRVVAGSPADIADTIEEWFTAGAADGFNLMPDVLPSGLAAFAEHVVPELRRRGLFRDDYAGATLRDHFGLARPPVVRHAPDTAEVLAR